MSEHESDRLIDHVARRLRSPVEADHAFDARVLASVRAIGPKGARRSGVLRALTRPRLAISPLTGFALAAGIAGIAILADRALRVLRPSPPGAIGDATAAHAVVGARAVSEGRPVQFILVAPTASSVSLVGSFNDWDPQSTPLRRTVTGGAWMVEIPLVAGRHQYAFIVDGKRWMPDPSGVPAVEDDFGLPNSVVTVSEAAT
jgi:hypothetical protein